MGPEKKIIKVLKRRGWYISVMESCTGGAIANCITNIPGASVVFKEGLVTYCDEAKVKAGVEAKIIEKFGVYSFAVAEEMAKKTKGELGVGVTGELPGLVYIAVRINDKMAVDKIELENMAISKIRSRIKMKKMVVGKVMEMIWEGIR